MAMQFFEWLLDLWAVNKWFSNLINIRPCEAPYDNVWYKDSFSGWLRGDSKTWIKGRDWFEQCAWADLLGYNPTDIIEIEWKRYVYAVSDDWFRAKIFVQCSNDVFDGCSLFVKEWCCAWTRADITEYSFKSWANTITQDFFPRTPCIYDKFQVTKFPKGTPKVNRCDWVIRNQLVGDAIVATLYNIDWSPVIGTTGDTIYIYWDSWTGNNAAIGQVRTIVRKNDINSGAANNAVVDFAWLGIKSAIPTYTYQYDPTTNSVIRFSADSVWIDQNNNTSILFDEIKNVCYTIYGDFWDVPIFASSDWLHALTADWCAVWTWEFVPYGNLNQITNNNIVPTQLQISSIFNYQWELWFINSKTWYIFIWLWWYNNWYFTTQKTILVWKIYDVAIPFQSYLLLMWRSATGIVYRSWTATLGTQDLLYSDVLSNIWYFSKNSLANDKENVYFVSNEKYLYSLDVTPISDFVYTKFKAKLTDLSEFIRSDLEQLDRTRWDQVTMSSTESAIRLFISDPATITAWTKIIFFDTTWKFWYKWIVCDIYLRDEKFGCWFGDVFWNNVWDTDNWNPVKQIIWFSFDEKLYLEKMIQVIWLIIWFNSRISRQNTTLKIEYDLGWWHQVIKFNKFQRSQYVRHIAQSKNENDWALFESAPIGMWFHWGNWFRPLQDLNYNNEFQAFCEYEPLIPDSYLSECNYANTPKMKGRENCKKTYPAGYTHHIDDSNDDWYITISKYGVLKYDLWVHCENIYCEIICDRWDFIEFWWLSIGYELWDTATSMANVLTFPWPTPDKIPEKPVTRKQKFNLL